MSIDVFVNKDGTVGVSDTVVYKGRNILSIQEGSLEYAPETGIDLKKFLNPDVKIQNETFRAYAVQKLGEQGVNPVQVLTNRDAFRDIIEFTVEEIETGSLIV